VGIWRFFFTDLLLDFHDTGRKQHLVVCEIAFNMVDWDSVHQMKFVMGQGLGNRNIDQKVK